MDARYSIEARGARVDQNRTAFVHAIVDRGRNADPFAVAIPLPRYYPTGACGIINNTYSVSVEEKYRMAERSNRET